MDRNIEEMFFSLPPEKRMEVVSKLMDSPAFHGGMKPGNTLEEGNANSLAPLTPTVSAMGSFDRDPTSESPSEQQQQPPEQSSDVQPHPAFTPAALARAIPNTELFVLLLGLRKGDANGAKHVKNVLEDVLGTPVQGLYLQKGELPSDTVTDLGVTEYGSPMQLIALRGKAVEESSDGTPVNVHRINLIINLDPNMYMTTQLSPSILMILHAFSKVKHVFLSYNSLEHYVKSTEEILKFHMTNVDYKKELATVTQTIDTFGSFSLAFNTLLSEIATLMQDDADTPKALDRYAKAVKTFTASMKSIDPRKTIQESETYKRFFTFIYNFRDLMKLNMFVSKNEALSQVIQGHYASTNDIVRKAVAYQIRSEIFKDLKEEVVAGFEAMREQDAKILDNPEIPIVDMLSLKDVYDNFSKYKAMKMDNQQEIATHIQEFFRIYDLIQDTEYASLSDGETPLVWLPMTTAKDDKAMYDSLDVARQAIAKIGNTSTRAFIKQSVFGLGETVLNSVDAIESCIDVLSGVSNRKQRITRDVLLSFILANLNNKYFARALREVAESVKASADSKASDTKLVELNENEINLLNKKVADDFTSAGDIDTFLDTQLGKHGGNRSLDYSAAFDDYILTACYAAYTLLPPNTNATGSSDKLFTMMHSIPANLKEANMSPEKVRDAFAKIGIPYAHAAPVKKMFKKVAKPSGESSVMMFYKLTEMANPSLYTDDIKTDMAHGIHYIIADHVSAAASRQLELYQNELSALNIPTSTVQKYSNSDASIAQAFVDSIRNYYHDGVSKAQQEVLEKAKEEFSKAEKGILAVLENRPPRTDTPKQQAYLVKVYKIVQSVRSNVGDAFADEMGTEILSLFAKLMRAYGDSSIDVAEVSRQARGMLAKLLLKFRELATDENPGIQKILERIRKTDSLAQFRWLIEVSGGGNAEVIQQFSASEINFDSINLLIEKILEEVTDEESEFKKINDEFVKFQEKCSEDVQKLQLAIADIDMTDDKQKKQLDGFAKKYIDLENAAKKFEERLEEKKNNFTVSQYLEGLEDMKGSINQMLNTLFEPTKTVLNRKLADASMGEVDDRNKKKVDTTSAVLGATTGAVSVSGLVVSVVDSEDEDDSALPSSTITSLPELNTAVELPIPSASSGPEDNAASTLPEEEDNTASILPEDDNEDNAGSTPAPLPEDEEEDNATIGNKVTLPTSHYTRHMPAGPQDPANENTVLRDNKDEPEDFQPALNTIPEDDEEENASQAVNSVLEGLVSNAQASSQAPSEPLTPFPVNVESESDDEEEVQRGGGIFRTIPQRMQDTIGAFLESIFKLDIGGLNEAAYNKYKESLHVFLKGILAKDTLEDMPKLSLLAVLGIVIQQFKVDPSVNILKKAFAEKVDVPVLESPNFANAFEFSILPISKVGNLSLQDILYKNIKAVDKHKLPLQEYLIPYSSYVRVAVPSKGGRGKKAQVGGGLYDTIYADLSKVELGDSQVIFSSNMLSAFIKYLTTKDATNQVIAKTTNFHMNGRVVLLDSLQQVLQKKSGPLAKKLQKLLKGRILETLDTIVNKYVDTYKFSSDRADSVFSSSIYLLSAYYPSSEKAYTKFLSDMEEALKSLDIANDGSKKKLKDSDFDDVEKQRVIYNELVLSPEYKQKKELLTATGTFISFAYKMRESKDVYTELMQRYMSRKELAPYITLLSMVCPKTNIEAIVDQLNINRFEVQEGGGLFGDTFRKLKDKTADSAASFKTKLRNLTESIRDKMSPMRVAESILLNNDYALKDHLVKVVEKSKKDKLVVSEKNKLNVDEALIPNLFDVIVRQHAGASDVVGHDLPSFLSTFKNKKELDDAKTRVQTIVKKIAPPAPSPPPMLPPPVPTSPPAMEEGQNVMSPPPGYPSVSNPHTPIAAAVENSAMPMEGVAPPPPQPRRPNTPFEQDNYDINALATQQEATVPPATTKALEDKVKDFKQMPINNRQPTMTVAYASQAPAPEYLKGTMTMPATAIATVGTPIPSAPIMGAPAVTIGVPATAPAIISRVINTGVVAKAEDAIGINMGRKAASEALIAEYLNDLADFIGYMQSKGQKWMADIDGAIKRDFHGPEGIERKLGAKGDENAQKQARNDVRRFYNKFLGMMSKKSSAYFTFVKNYYMKDAKGQIKYVLRYLQTYAKLVDPNYKKTVDPSAHGMLQEEARKYEAIEKQFATLTSQLDQMNNNYYTALSGVLDRYGGTALMTLDDDTRVSTQAWIDDVSNDINKRRQKIKSYYKLNYSMADVIFDAQFVTLYVIKAIRIGFAYLALFLATRIFTPMYETEVFDKKLDPPSLMKFLLIYLGFDLSFNVFILIVLFLLKFLFKSEDNAFMIDGYLFQKFMLDYAVSMTILLALGAIVGSVIVNKKYFKYKYEGMRAIRAFQELMFYMSIVIFAFPYFMML